MRLALRLLRREIARDWVTFGLSSLLAAPAIAFVMVFLGATLARDQGPALRITASVEPSFDTAREPARPQLVDGRPGLFTFQGSGRSVSFRVAATSGGTTTGISSKADGGSLRAAVPIGSRVSTYLQASVRLIGRGRAVDARAGDALASTSPRDLRLSGGRAPAGTREIALTRSVMRRLRLSLGDVVGVRTSGALPTLRKVTVVGALTPLSTSASQRPDATDAIVDPRILPSAGPWWRVWLVDVPAASNTQGVGTGTSGSSSGGSDGSLSYAFDGPSGISARVGQAALLVPAIAIEAILLAIPLLLMSATIAIGMHRRYRERRLLELAGAPAGVLRTIVIGRGLAVGILAGLVACLLARAAIDVFGIDARLSATAVLVPAVIALGGSVLASQRAVVTARRLIADPTAQRPPDRALVVRSLGRGACWCVACVVCVVVAHADPGPSWVASVLGGSSLICALAMTRATAPGLVALPSLVPCPASARAAVRAVGRARWVSAPAATAIAVTAIAALLVLSVGTARSSSSTGDGSNATAATTRRLLTIGPGTRSDQNGEPIVARSDMLSIVGRRPAEIVELRELHWPDGAAASAFRDSGPSTAYLLDSNAKLVDPRLASVGASEIGVLGSTSTARFPLGHQHGPNTSFSGPPLATRPLARTWPSTMPSVFVGREIVAKRGLKPSPAPTWFVRLSRSLTPDEAGALGRRADALGLAFAIDGQVETTGSQPVSSLWIALIVGLVAAVVSLIAAALVAVERREEARRLYLIGSKPIDGRIGAALAAFTVSAVGIVLALLAIATMTVALATIGSLTGSVATFAVAFAPLLAVPPLLAVGAFALARPPHTLGRFGRVPRDAADVRA